jgi:acyl-coenzyme A synthetase/AMP-(fatty) acid ligase
MDAFPPWVWRVPERFNIGVACTDAHLDGPIAEREAVVVDDDAHGVQSVTFRELALRTSRFAEVLRQLGVAAGDRVLVRLPNCLEYATAFFGAQKRGAIPVPTSTMLTADEVEYLAHDSGAVAMVTDEATWRAMGPRLAGEPALRDVVLVGAGGVASGGRPAVHDFAARLAAVSSFAPPHPTRADDPAYLVYTSGTTGYPKGVLHAHRALLGRQPSSEYWFDFDAAGDRVLHAGKYNWTYVLGTGLMDPLFRGHTTIVCEGAMDAAAWTRRIARHRATIFIAVPTIYRHILEQTTIVGRDLPTLRHCMSAGEQLLAEVLEEWRARFGLDVYEGLGMTECSYYLCQTKKRPIRPGSAGFAQPGHEVRLLDPETWQEVGVDVEGMICIPRDDPGLMLHYWNQPAETARCFTDSWFLTGDYARRDADGYLWFLGRKDDLIKTFGYRVSPVEVERVLAGLPGVAEVAAVGEELGPGKVVMTAYVVPHTPDAITPEAVLAYAQVHLASYKAPRIVYVVDDFPRTRNGKVLRRALSPAHVRARASTA